MTNLFIHRAFMRTVAKFILVPRLLRCAPSAHLPILLTQLSWNSSEGQGGVLGALLPCIQMQPLLTSSAPGAHRVQHQP